MKKFKLFGNSSQIEDNGACELYKALSVEEYTQYPYEKCDLDDGMSVINQVIGGYWKPRFLMDERTKTAVEFMDSWTTLKTIRTDDIDWQSLEGLPQDAIDKAKELNAHFPIFVRGYKIGVAEVSWQINPDGRYYMDEDGYGMTDDEEIIIYSYVDRAGKPLVKFRNIKDYSELDEMEIEARRNLKKGSNMNKVYHNYQAGVESIFKMLAQRVDDKQMQLVRNAYELAAEAHKEQKRKTGEPYITHPIAVARIVAEELELGANPVMAAFLHDVVEDTKHTIEDIRERFGEDVAFLVGVVTKQKKEKYDKSKQVDNYRQILASVQYDVRAILVKLADRLHNMRTLASMRPDKQMKIAGETDYFYAPLANRLGLYHVKTELENLSFHYRCPREYEQIEGLLEELKLAEEKDLEGFISKVSELLEYNGIKARIELRYRMPYSIWRKMRSKGCDFHHVDGKHYIRIIYDANDLQEEKKLSLYIYAVLSDYFKERPGSVANYINAPKENGYQSFHVKLLNDQGGWEEIHISSERMVRNSRLGCTAERTEKNVKVWLKKFKEVLKDVAYHSHEMDYMDGVTASFYNDDIMVFTPQGKGVILPKDATALDFAFEIHSEVGLHAEYARINGRLCSVKTVLHRGDCVEIGTDENALPEEEWLKHVLTYKAKRTLRSHFANKEKMPYIRCSCCHPLPGDEVIGFKDVEGVVTLHKRNCPDAIRMASEQGDSIVAINFEEQEDFFFPVRVCIRGIDRHHLLSDVVACITEKQNLSISRLNTVTVDRIVETSVDFVVHSVRELENAMESILAIRNVDEVSRIDIE